MNNFESPDIHSQKITVIGKEKKNEKNELMNQEFDFQALPESGHLVEGIENSIGIVVKNQKGFGVSGLKIRLIDSKNAEIATTQLNAFGIGKIKLKTIENE